MQLKFNSLSQKYSRKYIYINVKRMVSNYEIYSSKKVIYFTGGDFYNDYI